MSNDNQTKISPVLHNKWSCETDTSPPLIPEKQAVLCIDHQCYGTKGIFFGRAGPDQSVNQFSFIFPFLQRKKKIKLNKSLRKCYFEQGRKDHGIPLCVCSSDPVLQEGMRPRRTQLPLDWGAQLRANLEQLVFQQKVCMSGMQLPDSADTPGASHCRSKASADTQRRCRYGGSFPLPELAVRESCCPLTGTWLKDGNKSQKGIFSTWNGTLICQEL